MGFTKNGDGWEGKNADVCDCTRVDGVMEKGEIVESK
jgi:hypothetical protein